MMQGRRAGPESIMLCTSRICLARATTADWGGVDTPSCASDAPAYFFLAFCIFVPYFDRAFFRFTTPWASRAPRMMW